MRCRSDRQAGQAKQHAQIAHTEVTLSGPSVICNNNSLSVPVDLWRADTMALHAPCFARSQVRAFRSSSRTTKVCERRYHAACLYGNVTRWLKRKEQSMNYCQRSLRVLILARVQICSMQEQSTLRHISQSVCCSPRHGTKLTKHGEMCNNYSLHNPQCDFIDWNSLQRWRFGATGRALVAAAQINNVF